MSQSFLIDRYKISIPQWITSNCRDNKSASIQVVTNIDFDFTRLGLLSNTTVAPSEGGVVYPSEAYKLTLFFVVRVTVFSVVLCVLCLSFVSFLLAKVLPVF